MPVSMNNGVHASPDKDPKMPYLGHGMVFLSERNGEATAECPFCNREGKFSLHTSGPKAGQWKCWVCAEGTDKGGGNLYTFIRKLHKMSVDNTVDADYTKLADNRSLMSGDTLAVWGVAKSIINGQWLIPTYNVKGELSNLYRYAKDAKSKGFIVKPTATLPLDIFGRDKYNPKKPVVWMLEGPWDGMAAWEVLRIARANDDDTDLIFTGNDEVSLLKDINVLMIPGCGSVGKPFERWLPLFAGKQVVTFFDNDLPRKNGKTEIPPAGLETLKRAVRLFSGAEKQPASVSYVKWGIVSGNQYDTTLPNGYDVRDILSAADDAPGRIRQLKQLTSIIDSINPEWVPGGAAVKNGKVEVQSVPCSSYADLYNQFRQAMKVTDGLNLGLSVILATIASTPLPGDQLWIKLVGPPSSGKSTLCDMADVNRRYVVSKSVLTGLHSGYKSDKKGDEDHSLIKQIDGKTLIIKDGDTLMKSMNKDKVMSELRDLYDGRTDAWYNNGIGNRNYSNHRTTLVMCGTGALDAMDNSELGERFVTAVIMESIEDKFEWDVVMRVINRTDSNLSQKEDSGNVSSSPEMVLAMQMCGGYIDWLRDNVRAILPGVVMTDDAKRLIQNLSIFMAYLRARPSKKQEETVEREFGTRLASQLVRLTRLLCVARNKTETDEEIMSMVRRVGLATARGRTMQIVRHLATEPVDGMDASSVAGLTGHTEEKETTLLYFLKKLGAVERFSQKVSSVKTVKKWRLTGKMLKLYREVEG